MLLRQRKCVKETDGDENICIGSRGHHWLDRASQLMFPLAFSIFNIVYWSATFGKLIQSCKIAYPSVSRKCKQLGLVWTISNATLENGNFLQI